MSNTNTHFQVTGLLQTGLRFERFPDALREALRMEIEQIAQEMFDQVAALVPRATGSLAARERLRSFEAKDRIGAVVDFGGGNATSGQEAQAGALEYGSRGRPVKVKSYTSSTTEVFGRALSRPHDRIVKAYERVPNIRPRPFVRPVAASMQNQVLARLERVVSETTDKVDE